jgi:hypothetical protein
MLVIYWNYILEYIGMLAQERDRWRALVGTVRDFGFHKCGEFLD